MKSVSISVKSFLYFKEDPTLTLASNPKTHRVQQRNKNNKEKFTPITKVKQKIALSCSFFFPSSWCYRFSLLRLRSGGCENTETLLCSPFFSCCCCYRGLSWNSLPEMWLWPARLGSMNAFCFRIILNYHWTPISGRKPFKYVWSKWIYTWRKFFWKKSASRLPSSLTYDNFELISRITQNWILIRSEV